MYHRMMFGKGSKHYSSRDLEMLVSIVNILYDVEQDSYTWYQIRKEKKFSRIDYSSNII